MWHEYVGCPCISSNHAKVKNFHIWVKSTFVVICQAKITNLCVVRLDISHFALFFLAVSLCSVSILRTIENDGSAATHRRHFVRIYQQHKAMESQVRHKSGANGWESNVIRNRLAGIILMGRSNRQRINFPNFENF